MPYILNGKLVFHYSNPYLNLPNAVHDQFVELWTDKLFLLKTDSPEINKSLLRIYRDIQKLISKSPLDAIQRDLLADLFTKYIEFVRKIVAKSYSQTPNWKCPICSKVSRSPISILGCDKKLQQLGQRQYQPEFISDGIPDHWSAELMLQAIQYCSQRFLIDQSSMTWHPRPFNFRK